MAKFSLVSTFDLVGNFQMEVLRSVAMLESNAYGSNIRLHLQEKMKKGIHMPQVYAALIRLQELGMVSSFFDVKASAGRKGRTRRVFSIEAPGQRMLAAGQMLTSKVPDGMQSNAIVGPKTSTA